MPNQIMAIAPYWLEEVGTWVFDDPGAGLCQEPFVNAPLSSVIPAINTQQQIVLSSVLHVQDSTGNTGDFTMKNDTPGTPASGGTPAVVGVFDAKIAFLEDDTSSS